MYERIDREFILNREAALESFWREWLKLRWRARLTTNNQTSVETLAFYLREVPSLLSHPNITPALIHRYCWSAPRYLPQNPALPLLLLEDPSLAQYLRET